MEMGERIEVDKKGEIFFGLQTPIFGRAYLHWHPRPLKHTTSPPPHLREHSVHGFLQPHREAHRQGVYIKQCRQAGSD